MSISQLYHFWPLVVEFRLKLSKRFLFFFSFFFLFFLYSPFSFEWSLLTNKCNLGLGCSCPCFHTHHHGLYNGLFWFNFPSPFPLSLFLFFIILIIIIIINHFIILNSWKCSGNWSSSQVFVDDYHCFSQHNCSPSCSSPLSLHCLCISFPPSSLFFPSFSSSFPLSFFFFSLLSLWEIVHHGWMLKEEKELFLHMLVIFFFFFFLFGLTWFGFAFSSIITTAAMILGRWTLGFYLLKPKPEWR